MNKLYTTRLAFVDGLHNVHRVLVEESSVQVAEAREEEEGESLLAARVEHAMQTAIARSTSSLTPPLLRQAIAHAVFPGGARLRPQLCLIAAIANGDTDPGAADAAAASIELLHCASLVHDDMPCFDNADLRRGRPSVHKKFGEPTALLVGDALIVHAFAEVGRAGHRAGDLLSMLAGAAGAARGIIAGQAWENEPSSSTSVPLEEYHRAKTASLFEAAAMMGAVASRPGADTQAWGRFGEAIGRVYQAADDLADASSSSTLGKPVGQDALLQRPSLVGRSGSPEAARKRLRQLVSEAFVAIPSCGPHGTRLLREWMTLLLNRFNGA